VVDGAVNKVAELIQGSSLALRRLQSGVLQHYILAMVLGILVIASLYMVFQ
jgi:multicomponent Na+:H+ antiporter subunit D